MMKSMFAAVLVAFFPTGAPDKVPPPSWWIGPFSVIHHASATVLLVCFMVFCVVLFPQTHAGNKTLTSGKKWRNGIYYFCGAVIGVSLVWIGIAMSNGGPIFLPESVALEFFAISWLVKGRADYTIFTGAPNLAAHYRRHPKQLAHKAWDVVSGKQRAESRSPKNP